MPRYITVTPKYNPISIDEYLKVPMLMAKEYDDEEKTLEAQQDKLSYVKALLGDRSGDTFKEYDAMMDSIKNDPSIQNMKRYSKQLRGMYRDIVNRAEIAKENRDRYQKIFDKDPTMIGNVGTFADYFNNPDYRPSAISGSDLEKAITTWAAQKAQQSLPRFAGYIDHDKSQMIYKTGYDDNQLATIMADATSDNPQTTEGKELGTILNQYGYNGASQQDKEALARHITKGLSAASEKLSTSKDPEYRNASQILTDRYNQLRLHDAEQTMQETGHMKVPKDDKRWSPYTLTVTDELKKAYSSEFKTAYPDGEIPKTINLRRIVFSNGNIKYELPNGTQFLVKAPSSSSSTDVPRIYTWYNGTKFKGTITKEDFERIDNLEEIPPSVFESKTKVKPSPGSICYYNSNTNDYIEVAKSNAGTVSKGSTTSLF